MNEKRVLLAAMLSAIFLAWYSQAVMRDVKRLVPQPKEFPAQSLAQQTQTETSLDARGKTLIHPIIEEEVTYIESDGIKLEIGQSSGAIRRAELKKFLAATGKAPLSFGSNLPLLQVVLRDQELSWKLIENSQTSAVLETKDKTGKNYRLSYLINQTNSIVTIELAKSSGENGSEFSIISTWERADQLENKQNILEAMLASSIDGKLKHKKFTGPWKTERIVPRGTSLLSLSERYFCESIKPIGQTASVNLLPSGESTIAAESRLTLLSKTASVATAEVAAYIGPRDYFYLSRAGFESAFPIGILGKIGLMMLTFLGWLASVVGNYGVGIILFSGIITLLMAPFTLLGFRSMKKMQNLKPRIDRLTAQHKGDPQRVNRELLALYKEHKVSPLSGCLPMLIQFPVFIALFQAISHYVELRGRPFLWIKDLSLPDHMAKLPFSLPMLGEHLNALPVIMAAAMYVQTKMSQANVAIDQNNPAAKMMSGPLMSVLFGFMFYQFPSGLVLYWLTNSLFSLIIYRAATTTA